MSFENLFSLGAGFRMVLGIIFTLFIICFVVIFVEETFLGGRRRRKAQKAARKRERANQAIRDPAPQNSDTHHPR